MFAEGAAAVLALPAAGTDDEGSPMPDGTDRSPDPGTFTGRFAWAGRLLGFGFGGLFDGILLHQVLQWHHLLSALEGAAFRDLRVQVLADGLFHLVMYAVSGVGLWLLWRSRHAFASPGADRRMAADLLIGFGVWHVIDGILSHWILGIHRIRMDSGNPLLWDLVWFLVFGIAFIAVGWLLRRGAGPGRPPAGKRRAATPVALTLAVLAAGAVAARPPPDVTTAVVVFRPDVTRAEAFAALAAMDARILWSDAAGGLFAIDLGPGSNPRSLYAQGALLVSRDLVAVGCLAWSRV
jgi:uncharacterized membrane protein